MMKRPGALVAAAVMILSGCASTGGSVDESEPEGSNADSNQGGETSANSESKPDPTFGQTYTWPGGLSVRVSRPKPYTPSQTASFDKRPTYREFEITLINKTGAKVDSSLVSVTVQSGDEEMTEVFDSEKGLNGSPTTALLDGRQARWRAGFGVKNPKDIVLELNTNVYEPEILEPVVFVRKK